MTDSYKIDFKKLQNFYRDSLLNDCIPFWLKYSLDEKNGGYYTCLDQKGDLYSSDKSVWFQGRGLWIYSKLCNDLGKNDQWLSMAHSGYEFLNKYCFDKDGRMFFLVTEDGRPLRKRRYMFSETFAIIAFAEYYKATGNYDALLKSRSVYDIVLSIYKGNKDNKYTITPKYYPETRQMKGMNVPMILLNTNYILREIDTERKTFYDEQAKIFTDEIFRDFMKPEVKALFETVGLKGERIDSPEGRCLNPGHAIEAAWFLMHEAIYYNDENTMNNALNILDWSLDIGWDKEYGGILYFVDVEGKPPQPLEWDMKLWWPHTEALYALLLAYKVTGNVKYLSWYNKMHDYTFDRFPDKEYGEWFGYLHRDGSVSHTFKGSIWKGPFHIPRALLFCMNLLDSFNM